MAGRRVFERGQEAQQREGRMSIKAILAELQKDYVASIPHKIATISEYWRTQKLEDLQTEYHKLKGTGRTYGLPEVTQLGEALEALCISGSSSLPIAVPLSINVLERIRAHRELGTQINLEEDRDFQVIIELVMSEESQKK